MSLLVIGSVAFDALETPFGKTDKIIGGAATYISLAASYSTKPVNLVAVVGGDFPQSDILTLEEHGVNVEGLQIKPDEKSFFWSGKYSKDLNSRETITTELNVLGSFDPIIPDSYQDCKWLMQVQRLVVQRLVNRPKLIVLDTMNFWMDSAPDELLATIEMVDVLSINDEEARQLSGEYSLVKAARKILALGPKFLIIKKGEHGALLFHKNKVFYAPALPLEEVFDPTGAGDTFAGGFMGHIAATDDYSFENIKRAVIHGSAMASFCVEKFGTERLLNLTQEEIEAREAQFEELVKVQPASVVA
jgi:sugar/nucleoside kinase (ribokinase family)